MASACLQFTIHYSVVCPFFRVEWAEKDFLGRLGQRELRWIKTILTYFLLFLKYNKYLFNYCKQMTRNTVYLSLQGEPGITGNVGLMGERVRLLNTATSIFSSLNIYLFIHSTLCLCISGLGWFHRACGRGGTGRGEGKILVFSLSIHRCYKSPQGDIDD